jgi:hypothetical protein
MKFSEIHLLKLHIDGKKIVLLGTNLSLTRLCSELHQKTPLFWQKILSKLYFGGSLKAVNV